jgi:hypothetical protein
MAGPYVHPNPVSLTGIGNWVDDGYGKNYKECVSLLKYYIPELRNTWTGSWLKGPNVIETLNKGISIPRGTAIATFLKGKNAFTSGHGHAGFFVSARKSEFLKEVWVMVDENGKKKEVKREIMVEEYRITVVDQYHGSMGIHMRELKNYGKRDGEYVDYSNNGEACAVIL